MTGLAEVEVWRSRTQRQAPEIEGGVALLQPDTSRIPLQVWRSSQRVRVESPARDTSLPAATEREEVEEGVKLHFAGKFNPHFSRTVLPLAHNAGATLLQQCALAIAAQSSPVLCVDTCLLYTSPSPRDS
eukprot:TRINITY_DN13505_c0_g1_i14.p1 TRINITY_DN13505_c0_g1~~TRINITY_DN13505_c0_g1_i14.p1  ORF type:complete len:130 (+),score=21.06 TRINITY_DN13505_c0_g1_i14:698-1087(+)